jgi:hypothetical protein
MIVGVHATATTSASHLTLVCEIREKPVRTYTGAAVRMARITEDSNSENVLPPSNWLRRQDSNLRHGG